MRYILFSFLAIIISACGASDSQEPLKEHIDLGDSPSMDLCRSAIDRMISMTENAQEEDKTDVGIQEFEHVKKRCNSLDDTSYKKIATQYVYDLIKMQEDANLIFVYDVVRANENALPIVKGVFGDASIEITLVPGLGWQLETEH